MVNGSETAPPWNDSERLYGAPSGARLSSFGARALFFRLRTQADGGAHEDARVVSEGMELSERGSEMAPTPSWPATDEPERGSE